MTENKNEKQIDIPKDALLYKSEVDESLTKQDQETAENVPYELVEGYEVAKHPVSKQTDSKGRFISGNTVAKDKGVDFGSKPENRSDGRWKPEESISYLYNKFGRMSDEAIEKYKKEKEGSLTKFEKIALARVKAAEDSLNDAKEITDRTEGKAPQAIDMTSNGETINPMSGLTIEELRKLAGK